MEETRAIKLAKILYSDSLGYAIANTGKQTIGLTNDKTFTYGEISFDTFPKMLRESSEPHGVFYDLGSGTGKAVMMAGLLGHFHKVVGVELVPDLYSESLRIVDRFNKIIAPSMAHTWPLPEIQFINGNFFNVDWSEADCVFFQGTCFTKDILHKIGKLCDRLKPGAKIIVATTPLSGFNLTLKKIQNFKLGWGNSTIYFHEKL